MSQLRDHEPIIVDEFNGLWDLSDPDNTPIDHFQYANNIKHIGANSFGTRDGIGLHQSVNLPLTNIKRIYNYPTPTGNTLIVLGVDVAGNGNIYHVVNETTVYGPLLTIAGMTDFAFIPYAGRGYISPFTSFDAGGLNVEKGLSGQFLYVYAGDGTAARKAAGVAPVGALTVANGAAGHTDPGLHVFGVIYETRSGYLTAPGAFQTFTTVAAQSVSFGTVPVSGDANVIKRHIVASAKIASYNGDPTGYPLFFIPNGTINDNTTNFLNNVSFYDADLLDDASHLVDNYAEIPAGAVLGVYHNRLCLATTFTDISLILVSAPGEPEAISQIDGLIIFPLDGNPITNLQELRDVLYAFKRARTVSYVDNDDVPSSWPLNLVDAALGTSVHGVGTVLDSGSSSVDFLIVATYQGVTLFNGRYNSPELSSKISGFWQRLDRNEFRRIQIVNAPIQKEMYLCLPNRKVLCGNYLNGMDPKRIRWEPWSFKMGVNTVAIVNIDQVIFGADL